MTNEQRVRDLCRQIRGLAMNYPTGFDAVCLEVDTIRRLAQRGEPFVSRSDTPTHAPVDTQAQGEKRKPGRPRKQQGPEVQG